MTFLLTALTSLGLLLLGVALLLMATGSAHLERIATALGEPGLPPRVKAVAVLGVLLAVAGIAFKLSVVPFHLWTPDTYAGAPLPVAAFLSTVSKAAGAAAAVVLLTVGVLPLAGTLGARRRRRRRPHGDRRQPGRAPPAGRRPAARLVDRGAGGLGDPSARRCRVRPARRRRRRRPRAAVGYLAAYVAATLAVFAVVVVFARHHPAGEEHTVEAYRGPGPAGAGRRRRPRLRARLSRRAPARDRRPGGQGPRRPPGRRRRRLAGRPDRGSQRRPRSGLLPPLGRAAVRPRPGPGYPPGGYAPPRAWRWARPAAACVALSVWPQFVAGLAPGLPR